MKFLIWPMKTYWHPNYWGVAIVPYVQTGSINFGVGVSSRQRMLDPAKLVETGKYRVSSKYDRGKLVSTFTFDVP